MCGAGYERKSPSQALSRRLASVGVRYFTRGKSTLRTDLTCFHARSVSTLSCWTVREIQGGVQGVEYAVRRSLALALLLGVVAIGGGELGQPAAQPLGGQAGEGSGPARFLDVSMEGELGASPVLPAGTVVGKIRLQGIGDDVTSCRCLNG